MQGLVKGKAHAFLGRRFEEALKQSKEPLSMCAQRCLMLQCIRKALRCSAVEGEANFFAKPALQDALAEFQATDSGRAVIDSVEMELDSHL